ncbi:cell wall metabolism sensor histidine kinase WalK [Sutcliffiella horikoshii]|uniref:two-component system histidine kinase PnpS n=1 Tax=Sutcliffiella horikoshii TaxID=79883 RepID=UPI00203F09F6|nr:ATP-binding protein [Sutcliffiella horikoshii]MCM3619417.1 cell wall metabolism sensor histidine kinase WalK [Sutcliffiella horikoshii]
MNRFRSRLLFALITLIVVVLVCLGLLLGQLFKTFYLNTFNQRLVKETNLVTMLVEEEETITTELQKHLEDVSGTLTARISITDKDGIVLFDTNGPSPTGEDSHQDIIKDTIQNNKDRDRIFYEQNNEFYYYGSSITRDGIRDGYVILSTPIDSLQRVNQQIWGLLIASLGAAFVVILLLGVRITSQYTRPIESATKVAMELAKGNYKARTFEEHVDETGMLSQSINILARNLQDMTKAQEMQQDRLRTLIESMGSGLILIDGRGYVNLINRAYKETFDADSSEYLYRLYYEAIEHKEVVSLIEEIFMTEVNVRKQLLLPLKIERRHFEVYGAPIIGINDEWKGIVLVFHDISELKKLEQMRKDFVANVSHELKTPITSIKGFSETLLDGAMNDKDTLEYFLSIILKESDRLQSLIEDLLDLSKIEKQGFKLNPEYFEINGILEEIFVILKRKAKEKEIELLLNRPPKDLFLFADASRVKQVFINLINNAIAYTPAGGEVKVNVEEVDGEIVIVVSDTGVGMEQEEIPRIFERFYRVDKARSRNSGGTGLGLAIVKHIVEAHHGSISVKSKLDNGTTFTVKLSKENKDLQ